MVTGDLTTPPQASETVDPPRPATAAAKKGEVEIVEPTRLQTTVSRRIAESKATVPHTYMRCRIRLADAASGPEGELTARILRATADALRSNPRANGAYKDARVELYSRINVAVATETDDGLQFPVIADADTKSATEIGAEISELTDRARSGAITSPELAGATFTIFDLSDFPITGFDAVVPTGQAGILAVGGANAGNEIEATLSCDHRILYGRQAARFLAAIKAGLEGAEGPP